MTGPSRRGPRFEGEKKRRVSAEYFPMPGELVFSDPAGEDWIVDGPESDQLRAMMRDACPICREEGHGYAV